MPLELVVINHLQALLVYTAYPSRTPNESGSQGRQRQRERRRERRALGL